MRYNFRLNETVKTKLDAVSRSYPGRRSGFIRDAIAIFLVKPRQSLADRPRLKGVEKTSAYVQVCAVLTPDQVEAIKAGYPDVSVSVVIQAAVSAELKRARYRIADRIDTMISGNDKRETATNEDADRGKRAAKAKGTSDKFRVRDASRTK
uniref:hypothetical protein n=1 Tax=Cupriavidus gilardii TaxID=82541 RepID=UPI00247AB865|nr:hypothetical protein [Cupriavidus gilardii]WDE72629.1 hypothetical protein [Cupriavidus gilardii]